MYAVKQKQGNRFFNSLEAARRFQMQAATDKKIRLDIYKRVETFPLGYVKFEKVA